MNNSYYPNMPISIKRQRTSKRVRPELPTVAVQEKKTEDLELVTQFQVSGQVITVWLISYLKDRMVVQIGQNQLVWCCPTGAWATNPLLEIASTSQVEKYLRMIGFAVQMHCWNGSKKPSELKLPAFRIA